MLYAILSIVLIILLVSSVYMIKFMRVKTNTLRFALLERLTIVAISVVEQVSNTIEKAQAYGDSVSINSSNQDLVKLVSSTRESKSSSKKELATQILKEIAELHGIKVSTRECSSMIEFAVYSKIRS